MSSKRWSFLSHIRASTKKVKTKVLDSLAQAKKVNNSEPELETGFVGNASVEEEGWEDSSSSLMTYTNNIMTTLCNPS